MSGRSAGPRANRVGKGKHRYALDMQRHFDELNFEKWKQRKERRLLRKIAYGRVS